MLDTNSYTFHYLTDEEQPYYLEVTYHGSTVIAGFAPGDIGDTAVFEITDKYDGKQLATVNIRHADMVNQWHDLVTKAHHLVLSLHAEAVKQAERDKEWTKLLNQAMSRFENIDQYLAKSGELVDSRNVGDKDIELMKAVVEALTTAGDKLDLIADPE